MIITDTDFLSAFLKIGKLSLIFTALETKEIVITGAVLHELEQAPVYDRFLEALHSEENKIVVKNAKETESKVLRSKAPGMPDALPPSNLGKGELESISLANKANALLLMDDRKAAKFAESKGVTVMDVPIFLLHCKTSNLLSNEELNQIVRDLKEKDYYEFSEESRKTLLE